VASICKIAFVCYDLVLHGCKHVPSSVSFDFNIPYM